MKKIYMMQEYKVQVENGLSVIKLKNKTLKFHKIISNLLN